MSKREAYRTVSEAYQGALDYDDGAFGQWIDGLWGWTPALGIEEQKENFFLLLEYLLREGKVVLDIPNDIEEGSSLCKMRQQADWNDVWNIPIEDQIAYIKKHFPKDLTDPDDLKITDFFFGDYCPRIGWVYPETGEIIAS